MADQTTASITIAAPAADVMTVIADIGSYPDWTGAVKQAKVISTYPDGRAQQASFVLESGPIKDEYTLAYTWNGDREVRWSLVEAGMLKQMNGSYALTDKGADSTEVTYTLAVDVRIPLLGMIKRKAEKVIIDTALKELKKRVEG
jgi:ribosome-associated toxin RatA of RatAB toxin-antitoxin module